MIDRDPAVRDHFLVLEPRESFGDLARAYGNAIAEHYENRGVVVIPSLPIRADLDLVRSVAFPPDWKKIGTVNGIERPVFKRADNGIAVDETHPFIALGNVKLAAYLQAQVASFNAQLRHGLSLLLPCYRSMRELNITWRLLETVQEGLHLDVFKGGLPLVPRAKTALRVKIFINIDLEPRHWRTSHDVPAILAARRDRLPADLPDDLNVVNDAIDRYGALDDLPGHTVRYPTLSAVLVNAEVVAHEVVYGRRLVAGEFAVHADDMLDRRKLPHACLRTWLEEAGYQIAPDAAAVQARQAHLKSAYQRIQEGMPR